MIPAFGVHVSVHYCGGEVASIALGTPGVDACACGSKTMKSGCCDDKHYAFEVEDDQIQTQQNSVVSEKDDDFSISYSTLFEPEFDGYFLNTRSYNFLHPPNWIKLPLYKLHRVFRI